MEGYLDTRGNSTLGIGICDRCSRKFPIGELYPDYNIPALRVCKADRDDFDPWRLPARTPDQIAVRHPRPDVELS
jgi:hypothetical protein